MNSKTKEMVGIADAAASFNSIVNVFEATVGQAASGKPLSGGERALSAVSAAATPFGFVAKAGNVVKGANATSDVLGAAKGVNGYNKAVAPIGAVVRTTDELVDGQGGLCLFKFPQKGEEPIYVRIGSSKPGDHMLFLPNQGSPKANWKQNAGALRAKMKEGKPIFDTFIDETGKQLKTDMKGFIDMERHLLKSRGWIYNPTTGAYYPPTVLKGN